MSTNGGASMVVSSQTSAAEQEAMAQQIAYNMQNNIPWNLTTQSGDVGANVIQQNIVNQAQTIAMTPQSPTVGSQVSVSTTGNNPSAWDKFLDIASQGGGASSVAAGPAEQVAAAGASTPEQAAAGGYYNASDANLGINSTTTISQWLSSHMANYGLVIMGGLLVLGALLISQREKIQTVVKTAGKAAEITG